MAVSNPAMIDLETLRHGLEDRDQAAMLSLYDDGAEIAIVDQRHTPSHPQVIRGREQIRSFLSDLLSRDMEHHLDHVVAGEGTVSFIQRCRYPDGSQVTFQSVLDIENGHIVRQEGVQAWDEPGAMTAGYQDFGQADEVRTFEKGRLELLHTPAGDVGRMILEPGWRWSEHVRPIAGTDLCQQAHFGYQLAGRLRIQLADGTTIDAAPGQVGTIPPGHDAWVVGDEPCVLLDWVGASGYARPA
jgi:quercetin dioxygenase-like cupin family protein